MKKTLLNLALVASLGLTYAQAGLGATGAHDDFKDANPVNAGVNQYSYEDKDHFGWDSVKKAPTKEKAYKGIYWWEKQTTGLDFSWKREGNGVLAYTFTQAAGAYEPFGVGFGQYAESATATSPSFYTLDLSNNSNVALKFKNLTGTDVKVTLQLQDIDGVSLGYHEDNVADPKPENLYMYDVKLEVLGDDVTEQTLEFDFSKATGSAYVFNPESEFGCDNLPVIKDKATTAFKYNKVKGLVITVTNLGQLTAAECYGRKELIVENGKFEITSLKIGDQSSIVGVSDETIAAFNNEVVTVYNFSGAVVAQGNLADLNLTSGFYILKSASKTQKIMIK